MKKSFADMMASMEGELGRKMAAKVPEWAPFIQSLQFPSSLSTEQCSSSEAALYKAGIASAMAPGGRIADLTGGLGVDCWAFSRVMSAVLHNERNPELSAAVKSNMETLGISNIETRCSEIDGSNISELLSSFRPDIVYMDPARRSTTGKKVFLLEECEPDILGLLPLIWKHCGKVLVKVSPMADISMLAARLDGRLREVHVVTVGGEVKELLLRVERDWTGDYSIHAAGISFTPKEEAEAEVRYPEGMDYAFLVDPSPALLKAGAFKLPCSRFGAVKLAASTHLYFSDEPVGWGKSRRVIAVEELNKRTLKSVGSSYPRCEVTARNIPMSSEELRKRLGAASGNDAHIYGVTMGKDRYLVICAAE